MPDRDEVQTLWHAKRKVHRLFDQLWRKGYCSRREAYRRLADRLGIEDWHDCHIAWFDLDACSRAYVAAAELLEEAKRERRRAGRNLHRPALD